MGPLGTLSPSNPGGGFPLSDPTPGGTLPPGVEGLRLCPDGVVMICGNAYSIENVPFAEEYGHTEILAIDGFGVKLLMAWWFTKIIRAIRMNRIGRIRMMLQIGNMWTITIVTCLMEWT